jgi:hypothetical protein
MKDEAHLISLVFRDPLRRPRLDSKLREVARQLAERAMSSDHSLQAVFRLGAVDARVGLFIIERRERLFLVFGHRRRFGEHGQRSRLERQRSYSSSHPGRSRRRLGLGCEGSQLVAASLVAEEQDEARTAARRSPSSPKKLASTRAHDPRGLIAPPDHLSTRIFSAPRTT